MNRLRRWCLALGLVSTLGLFVPAQEGFREIWGYLDAQDRSALNPSLPLTDVAVFAAGINSRGELVDVPSPPDASRTRARRHLVVAVLENTALTHFVLDPTFPLRDALVAAIADRAAAFEGVQIDFEAVAKYDKDNYVRFLAKLKDALGTKLLSVAVPARWRPVDDAQDYAALARVVDKLIVMAYDEHWSTSGPGPVASAEWGAKVAAYALTVLGSGKTVVGLPLYGRSWADANPSGGYRFSGIQRLLGETAAPVNRDLGGVPSFRFSKIIGYTVWYEDAASLDIKTSVYQNLGVTAIAFWRLGQEDPSVWPLVQKKRAQPEKVRPRSFVPFAWER